MGCCITGDQSSTQRSNQPLLGSSSSVRPTYQPTYQQTYQPKYQPQPTYRQNPTPSSRASNDGNCFGECTSKNQKTILSNLWKMEPQGQTKLRDAIMNACIQMHTLQKITEEMVDATRGSSDVNWRFVNVILTDGQDTSSTHSLREVKVILFGLDELLGNKCATFLMLVYPNDYCCTVISNKLILIPIEFDNVINVFFWYHSGIGSDENEFGELKQLAREIKSVSYIHVKDSGAIQEVFERIQVELGIVRQTAILDTGSMLIAAQQNNVTHNKQCLCNPISVKHEQITNNK
ncbi:hypothetical protein RFI_01802 [Reticulomyxa filosa]|uniref:VWFA domain-containing protein n=1 Tax=Reticulomyxa filosa TaxID=46433 RepID=X6PAV7_RETFI|nr:hypothetical protein RFI_01802 [Reticulomyxa filosa]|eukprot:ETO35263.1 hypothetical protein RFI_01802 [Reticulomyxa filosa]